MEQATAAANAAVGRASGGLFMSLFGGVWAGYGADVRWGPPGWVFGGLVAVLLAAGCLWLRRHALPHAVATDGTAEAAMRRGFRRVNVVQWIAIFAVAQGLIALHRQAWVLPAVMATVGLHFLPLARLFRYPAHAWTGLALLAWSLAYPWLGGVAEPQSFCGPLGAGLILWAAAARVLWSQRGWLAGRH